MASPPSGHRLKPGAFCSPSSPLSAGLHCKFLAVDETSPYVVAVLECGAQTFEKEAGGRRAFFWRALPPCRGGGACGCAVNPGRPRPVTLVGCQGWAAPLLPLGAPGDRLFSSRDSYSKGDPRILSTTQQRRPLRLLASWPTWEPLRAAQQGPEESVCLAPWPTQSPL